MPWPVMDPPGASLSSVMGPVTQGVTLCQAVYLLEAFAVSPVFLQSSFLLPQPVGSLHPWPLLRGSPADTACWLASPPEMWARPLLCSFFAPILMGFLYCSSYSNFQTDTLSGCWSVWTPFDTAVVSPRIQVCGNTLSISLGRA